MAAALFVTVLCGCGRYQVPAQPSAAQIRSAAELTSSGYDAAQRNDSSGGDHTHRVGGAGGLLTSYGHDAYHAEAIFGQDGSMTLLTFSSDITELKSVPERTLTGYARSDGSVKSHAFVLNAQPMTGDATGTTSRFEGQLPATMLDGDFSMTIAGLRVDERTYTLRFHFTQAHNIEANHNSYSNAESLTMPAAASLTRAQSLYLTRGGVYTDADIEANGRTTAAAKYSNFVAQHDPNPVAGDWICPITRTKANTDCAWIIAGETYYFCCPPCIDEFLEQAKATPERIKAPSTYKQPSGP